MCPVTLGSHSEQGVRYAVRGVTEAVATCGRTNLGLVHRRAGGAGWVTRANGTAARRYATPRPAFRHSAQQVAPLRTTMDQEVTTLFTQRRQAGSPMHV